MDFKAVLAGKQKEQFSSAINKLLNECFLVKFKGRNNPDYVFIMENLDMFQEYFSLINYQIIIDKPNGVIGLINVNGTGKIRFKKIESILLLIIREIYIEKRRELSLTDDIIIEASCIYDKYMLYGFNKKAIDKSTIPNALSLFKRYNLITVLDDKNIKDETRIIIHPSVLMAVTYDSLEDEYQKAHKRLLEYKNHGNSKEENVNEDIETNQAD